MNTIEVTTTKFAIFKGEKVHKTMLEKEKLL